MTTSTDTRGWVADDASFGARLALVRHRMSWNIKEAALACGIPQASWRGWELDGARPRDLLDAASKVATRTGCDFNWLLGLPRMDSNHQHPGLLPDNHQSRTVDHTRTLRVAA